MDSMKNLISDEELEPVAGGETVNDYICCPRCGTVKPLDDYTSGVRDEYLYYFTCDCGKKYTYEQLSAIKMRDPLELRCTSCDRKIQLGTGQMGTIKVIECYCGAHIAIND